MVESIKVGWLKLNLSLAKPYNSITSMLHDSIVFLNLVIFPQQISRLRNRQESLMLSRKIDIVAEKGKAVK